MKRRDAGPGPVAVVVAGVVLGALCWPVTPVRAASGLVILLQSGLAASGERRCLTRIREELLAGGFEVAVVDPGPRVDPVSIADAIERQRGSVATIALLGNPELGPSELWILDRVGAQAEVRRIVAPTDDPLHVPEVLAIRTIELLRASALKLLVESKQPPPPVGGPPTAPSPVDRAPDRSEVVGLEAGLAILQSVAGPGPAALPMGRLRVALRMPLFVRLTLAGLGTRPRVTTPLGAADIGQDLGLLEIGAVFRPQRRLHPTVTLGGGALYVRSSGDGVYPYRGVEDSRWAALVDGGAGVVGLLGARVVMAFEVHASLAVPHPVVRFSGVDAATIGRPAVMAIWTWMTWL